MAQNITLMGASYSAVPAVTLPKTGGGAAVFTDTSDATLASGDEMLSGVTAYSGGTKITGSIATKTSANLSASGATVTAEAGYYASSASKSVASGSATAPASITGTSASVSTGTNTLTLSKSISVTPSVTAGYVSAGTAGNSSVSLTASVTTKGATTYTPTTTAQTIASGQYLTGAQTIAGDANLITGNIKDGVSIFGVTGSYTGGGITPTGTISITTNGTVDVTNYAYANVNVSGGGSSSYTLVKSLEKTVSTTSTSSTVVDGFGYNFDSSKMYLITVRDKAGPRNGYFYGTDTVFLPVASGTLNRYAARRTYSYPSGVMSVYTVTNGQYSGHYGVAPDEIAASTGYMNVRSRYNASYSLTIDGTYIINAYEMAYPSGVPAPL